MEILDLLATGARTLKGNTLWFSDFIMIFQSLFIHQVYYNALIISYVNRKFLFIHTIGTFFIMYFS